MEQTYKRDFDLRKAHLKRDIDARLAKLPEYRRAYAEAAVNKVLWRYYREHGERFEILANVLLDALEHDRVLAGFSGSTPPVAVTLRSSPRVSTHLASSTSP